jgi:hypothetical protein
MQVRLVKRLQFGVQALLADLRQLRTTDPRSDSSLRLIGEEGL